MRQQRCQRRSGGSVQSGPGLHFLIESLSSSSTAVAALSLSSSSLSPRHLFIAVGRCSNGLLGRRVARTRKRRPRAHHSVSVLRPPVLLFFYVAEAQARKSSGRSTLTHTPQRSPLRVACRRPRFLVIQVRSSDYDTVRPRGFLSRRMTDTRQSATFHGNGLSRLLVGACRRRA